MKRDAVKYYYLKLNLLDDSLDYNEDDEDTSNKYEFWKLKSEYVEGADRAFFEDSHTLSIAAISSKSFADAEHLIHCKMLLIHGILENYLCLHALK